MRKRVLSGLVVLCMIAVVGCEREPEPDLDTGAAAEAPGWSPEAEMRATLSDLTHAQLSFHEQHGQFTDDLALLIEEHDFVPVGDVTVIVEFPPPGPEQGYLAVALHPLDDARCEQQHTITPMEERTVPGEIVCTTQ